MTQTGFASWVILTFILLTSFLPVRRLSYEIFVTLHIILFAGLIGAIYIHVDFGKAWIWACVGIFFADRFFRILVTLWSNIPLLHGKSGFWANQAILTPLPGSVTRITIDNPIIKWKAGQHMFLSCHSVVPLQAHPFTAASITSDNKLEFFVQAHKGGTRRMHRWASKYNSLPQAEAVSTPQRKYVGIEGPYGALRSLHQFDSIVLFAGSTGATFSTPLMRDIVHRWNQNSTGVVTKSINFVWVIKAKDRLCWFDEQLRQAQADVAALKLEGRNVELDISVYVTCDEKLEEGRNEQICIPSEHGDAALYSQQSTDSTQEEKKQLDTDVKVQAVSASSSDIASEKGCIPGGGCCCKKAVDDDNIEPVECCCKRTVSDTSNTQPSSSANSVSKEKPTQPKLKLYTGRPKVKRIIRKVLEEAEGESAVVVCGPQGLQDDVRHSVVSLSDERAVHKGTGAQGVYLHVEGFCY